ncbi:hypothetical protein HNR46_003698 [Haloferula luteola]|uniref:Uncharacterized protein n=1 Tax=Haloferula luteola TaxID=595692 RepID=A0A840V5B1_9BACT|nr:hypothetical protein [Haloferula luteola]
MGISASVASTRSRDVPLNLRSFRVNSVWNRPMSVTVHSAIKIRLSGSLVYSDP